MSTVPADPELPLTRRLQLEVHRKMLWLQCGLFAAMGLAQVVYVLDAGDPGFPWPAAGVVLASLAVLAFGQRTRLYRRALEVHNVCVFGAYALASVPELGLYSPSLWWLVLPPVLAVLVGSLRLGALLFIGLIVQTLWLARTGPQALDPALLAAGTEHTRMAFAVIGSSLVLGLVACLGSWWIRHLLRAVTAATLAAKEAEAVKARFLANMSHEIRTPLGGLIGAGELLLSPRTDAAQRAQLLGLQQHSAKALLALVNDILDWSKIEAGEVRLEAQPTNLRALVFEANELFATQAYAKGVEVTSSSDPALPRRFLCDPTRMRQIVNNLVGNAVKFTARGSVHLHLAPGGADPARAAPPPGQQWLRVEVADTGIGIAAHALPDLFKAFRQADESVTRRYGGTGLGLAICQELAGLMGGHLEVTSTPGQGSTFTLHVPLQALPEPAAQPAPAQSLQVLLATAGSGLQRHVGALLHELGLQPRFVCGLPGPQQLAGCTVLLLDAALLASAAELQAWIETSAQPGLQVAIVEPLGADKIVGTLPGLHRLYKPVRLRALRTLLRACATPPCAGAAAAPAAATAGNGGAHVLVVEDNPVNQVVVQAMLIDLGARCVLAGNGLVALECLQADRFDLVLMDMQMPELDGLGATRRLREREAGASRVPVIAMTASTERGDLEAMRDAGADGHLAKPFGIEQLRRCLDQWKSAGPAH